MTVTKPSWPSVKVKARASGMPAKFEATPEKVISELRRNRGSPPRMTAPARAKPNRPPAIAVTRLISMLFRNAARMRASERSA